MAKAPIAERRDPEDIGAAIISAWFKVLPDVEIGVASIAGVAPLAVTTTVPHRFRSGDMIYFYGVDGLYGVNGPTFIVGDVTPMGFEASPRDETVVSGAYVAGSGRVAASLDGLKEELTAVLRPMIRSDVNFQLVFDPQASDTINIAIPQPPKHTRRELIRYLADYHAGGPGSQYHEELGTAVLFGCGR